jgi:phasin
MADTTASTRKSSKAAGDKAAPFGIPGMEFPSFEMPKLDPFSAAFQPPPFLRDAAEKGFAEARAGYDKLKAAADEAGELAGETFETARSGIGALNLKALEAAKTNTDAGFAHLHALFGAKSLMDVFELQAGFVRTQATVVAEQARDLAETARRVAEDSAEPSRAAFGKALRELRLA